MIRKIIKQNGMPRVEVRPLTPRRFVPRKVIADAARGAPPLNYARFRADLEAIVDPGP